jgi:hypothetical protein
MTKRAQNLLGSSVHDSKTAFSSCSQRNGSTPSVGAKQFDCSDLARGTLSKHLLKESRPAGNVKEQRAKAISAAGSGT